MHYHVMLIANAVPPLMNMQFDDYDESLRHFVKLSKNLFGHYDTPESLTVLNAYTATHFGQSIATSVGGLQIIDQDKNLITIVGLSVIWRKCDGCLNVTMN